MPDKQEAFDELYRVLKPGGKIQIADVALKQDISTAARRDPKMWAECVVGAVPENLYVAMLRAAGFDNVQIMLGRIIFPPARILQHAKWPDNMALLQLF